MQPPGPFHDRHFDMNKPTQSDSILAASYVDGELSSADVATVEARIKSDTEFASVVEHLRLQSEAFRALPKFEPASDLAERTLQASVDQVKAIMGHWPVEEGEPACDVVAVSKYEGSNWKSIAALVMSLAGLLFLAVNLWPDSVGSSSSDTVASNEGTSVEDSISKAPTSSAGKLTIDAAGENSDMDSFAEVTGGAKGDLAGLGQQVAIGGAAPEEMEAEASQPSAPMANQSMGKRARKSSQAPIEVQSAVPFSGTPVQVADKAESGTLPAVAQIWMVNPDVSAKDIGKALAANQITFVGASASGTKPAVDLGGFGGIGGGGGGFTRPAISAASENSVDALYIAATPGQMKEALVELSGSADISLFEVPGAPVGNQIASAVQQQFQSKSGGEDSVQSQRQSSLPERIEPPQKTALAQQLVARNLPRSLPVTPVPPILSADLDEEIARSMGTAANSRGKSEQPPAVDAPSLPAQPKQDLAGSDKEAPRGKLKKATATPYDRYFDVTDQRLQTYLILVRKDRDLPEASEATDASVE